MIWKWINKVAKIKFNNSNREKWFLIEFDKKSCWLKIRNNQSWYYIKWIEPRVEKVEEGIRQCITIWWYSKKYCSAC